MLVYFWQVSRLNVFYCAPRFFCQNTIDQRIYVKWIAAMDCWLTFGKSSQKTEMPWMPQHVNQQWKRCEMKKILMEKPDKSWAKQPLHEHCSRASTSTQRFITGGDTWVYVHEYSKSNDSNENDHRIHRTSASLTFFFFHH